ncbi:hypothetical protein SPTER_16360 [Sporomusa termitida]|uniref:Carotenoid biosynthesis protein n=1 Tax=Sporomusa termitida TaxID=2377 RepID=A0A517DSI0_9FIRM|nr:hypothetical protein SPTER_16360 [Sporomusa termitida]
MTFLNGSKEMYISIVSIVIAFIGSYFLLRIDWKRYGLLYLIATIIGNTLCYIFVKVGFYSFPYIFLPVAKIPAVAVTTAFSFYVLFGVRYSPVKWPYKIAYYGVIVNLGVLLETIFKNTTDLIQYAYEWDFWDSYTSWWAFFILMEWIGGKIIPSNLRKPLKEEAFRFGNWFFFVIHFVGICTVFLAGLYLGVLIKETI